MNLSVFNSHHNYDFYPGDFDGDGDTDFVHVINDHYLRVWSSNGDGTFTILNRFPTTNTSDINPTWTDSFGGLYNFQVAELNGDGRADLIHIVGFNRVRCWLSNGDGTFTINTYASTDDAIYQSRFRFEQGDFNGDGLTDLIHFISSTEIKIWLADGKGGFEIQKSFRPNNTYDIATNDYRYVLGDYNGDGKTDLVHLVNASLVYIWTSSGDGAFTVTSQNTGGYNVSASNYHLVPADVNGDGLTDLIHHIDSDVDYLHVWLAKPAGGFNILDAYSTGTNATKPAQFQVGDFNGDGKSDFVFLNLQPSVTAPLAPSAPIRAKLFISTSPQFHRLNGIKDAFKNESTIAYQRLLPSFRYKKVPNGEASYYPAVFISLPMQVVAQIGNVKPQGGMTTVDYEYAGLKLHQRGGGLLGFRSIATIVRTKQPYAQPWGILVGNYNTINTTPQSALITQTTYSQIWPIRSQGMIESRNTYRKDLIGTTVYCYIGENCTALVGAQQLSSISNQISYKFSSLFQIFSFNSRVTSKQWDLNGTLISSSETNNTVDEYGNPTSSTTTVTDNQNNNMSYSTTTNNSYYPANEANWQLNLLSRQQETRSNPNQTAPYQPNSETRTTAFEYDTLGRLLRKITEPDNVYLSSKEIYFYNPQGLIRQTLVTTAGGTVRASTNEFHSNGTLSTRTNGLGHQESYFYTNPNFPWLATDLTDANGLTTQTQYDNLGRVQQQIGADKVTTSATWYKCSQPHADYPCESTADDYYYQLQQTSGQKPTLTYYNSLGQVVRTQRYQTVNGSDQLATQHTRYNEEGLAYLVSKPRFASEPMIYSFTEYDKLNRVTKIRDFNGSVTRKSYSGQQTTITDPLGRDFIEMKNVLGQVLWTQDADGQRLDFIYDAFGNLAQTSDSAGNQIKSQFDILGRKIFMHDPDQGDWRYEYDPIGQLLKQTDAMNQQTVMTYDQLGRMNSRLDLAARTSTSGTAYGVIQVSNGLCLQINASNGIDIGNCVGSANQSWRVNAGRLENPSGKCLAVEQTGFDSASNGTALQMQTCSTARSQQWTLGVSGAIVSANALCIDVDLAQYYGQGGKVQTWACNNSAQQTWAFNNPGQITNWVYDASITTRGKLTSESIGPVGTTPLQTKRYYYDAYGRNATVTTTIHSGVGAGIYTTNTSYDSFSRPQTQTYPNESLTIRHQYSTSSGQRIATKEASTGQVLWQLGEQNASGQLLTSTLGNNIKQQFNYDDNNRLTQIQTNVGSTVRQNWQVQYDAVGNVVQRNDLVGGNSEWLSYDNLNRLNISLIPYKLATNVDYDAYGNIITKQDVGDYIYGQTCNGVKAGPHAVTEIITDGVSSAKYCYDRNGNLISKTQPNGFNQQIIYTAFNKPAQIIQNGNNGTQLEYGSARELIRQTDVKAGVTTTSLYLPGYERIYKGSSVTEKFYIGDYAMLAKSGSNTALRFLLRDNQGSVTTILDQNGVPTENLAYDVWGKRRGTNWLPATTALSSVTTNQGYTGHRMLDNVGLIHMNGRVYDPQIARFVSADPIIQAPSDLQSYNRYAYVRNNPGSLTDPSGYSWLSKTWKKAWNNQYIRTAIAIGISVYMPGMLTSLSSFQAGMVTGFVSGGVSSGNLKGAFIGAVTGGLLDTVGAGMKANSLFSADGFAKVAAHGMIGGASSYANGGKFGAGFASMGFTQAASISGWFETGMFAGKYGNAIGSALVGGTASVAGGGDFAMGAYQGVLSRFLNDCAHGSICGDDQKNPAIKLAEQALQDGKLTLSEANEIWRNNTDPSFQLTVDASKLNVIQGQNFNANGYADGRLEYGSDWLVHGGVRLQINPENKIVIKSAAYNFEPHGNFIDRPVRNFETYGGFYVGSRAGSSVGIDYMINYSGNPNVRK